MRLLHGLGAGAALLGAAAPLAGSPFVAARGHIDVNQLAEIIAKGEDHLAPLQLAAWIRARKPGLRVIDVRNPEEFAAYAIPTAENIPLASLPRASFSDTETIVLYSEGGAHGAQAWMMLWAMGHENAVFISGGLVDWYLEVMKPELPVDASPDQPAASEASAELSRYFGGEPRAGFTSAGLAPATPKVPPHLADIRRRGC